MAGITCKPVRYYSKPQVRGASLIDRTGNLCSDHEISIRKLPGAVTGLAERSREGDPAVGKGGDLMGTLTVPALGSWLRR